MFHQILFLLMLFIDMSAIESSHLLFQQRQMMMHKCLTISPWHFARRVAPSLRSQKGETPNSLSMHPCSRTPTTMTEIVRPFRVPYPMMYSTRALIHRCPGIAPRPESGGPGRINGDELF